MPPSDNNRTPRGIGYNQCMGIFTVNVAIAKPSTRPAFVRAPRVMVDTGSEMTWIAADTLLKAGVVVRKKDQPFVMANGQQITRDVGYAIIRCGEFETIDEVVFARRGDLRLLGARTLEGFNAVVDARRKRLVAAGPVPAAMAVPRDVALGAIRFSLGRPTTSEIESAAHQVIQTIRTL